MRNQLSLVQDAAPGGGGFSHNVQGCYIYTCTHRLPRNILVSRDIRIFPHAPPIPIAYVTCARRKICMARETRNIPVCPCTSKHLYKQDMCMLVISHFIATESVKCVLCVEIREAL